MMNSWILTGARVALGPSKVEAIALELRAGKLASLGPSRPGGRGATLMDVHGCLILPGLINAHDHLEFSIFPRLGHGPYPNAGAWARDIYHPDRSPVRELLQVPLSTRLAWGGVCNLLSGVTTVCHHNPYHAADFLSPGFPVRVPREYGWAHSLEFSPDLENRIRRAPASGPFIVHVGEAVDRRGKEEIYCLDAMGALDSRTVLVHGVALGKREASLVRERGASVVWCPSSNDHILGRSLKAALLESGVRMALGTDSALSRQGCLLDELRLACRNFRVPPSRLYQMVTCEAAEIMRLRMGEGSLSEGAVADILVVRDRGLPPAAALLDLREGDIDMVMVGGEVKLCSARMFNRLPGSTRRTLRALVTPARGSRQVFVAADIPGLKRAVEGAREHLGPTVKAMLRPS